MHKYHILNGAGLPFWGKCRSNSSPTEDLTSRPVPELELLVRD